MEILAAIIGKATELTMKSIARQFSYVFSYYKNVEELNEVMSLKTEKEAVQHLIDNARRKCEEIEDMVGDWMHRVDEMIEQAESFYERESLANVGWSRRSFPNIWLRHQISRKAKKMATEVSVLKEKGNFDSISFQMLPKCRGPLEFKEVFESRISTMNEIMDALANLVVHMIGLHGLGGVSKTTLTKQVAKKAKDEKLFKMVIWVEVKHKLLKEIQSQIAYKLGLQFDMQSESEIVTANHLSSRLEKEESLLMLLDDLWKRLDFDLVGIPFTSEGNTRYKIVLTSRSEDLLLS